MTLQTLRPLSFGETLDRAFTLYRGNLPLFLGTSILTTGMMFLAALLLGGMGAAMVAILPGPLGLLFMAILLLGVGAVAAIPWGALARQASQSYTGKPASLGDGIRAGREAAMTLLGAGVLAAFTFGALMLVVMLVTYVLNLGVTTMGSITLSVLVSAVSALGMMVAFFFVAALFFAVVPAVVVEEKGPVDAIARSLQLARGGLPRIAGTMFVSVLITYLPVLATVAVAGGFAAVTGGGGGGAESPGGMVAAVLLQQLLTLGIGVTTMPFLLSVMTVLYYDRRVRTEALDVQQMLAGELGLAGA